MRILQFCKKTPVPPKDGESIAIHQLSKAFRDNGCDLHVFSLLTPKHSKKKNAQYIEGVEYSFKRIDTSVSYLSILFNIFFSSKSYIVKRFYDDRAKSKLIKLLQKEDFDCIQLEGVFLAFYIPTIRKYSSAKIILRAHNLEFKIWERLADNKNFLEKWYLNTILTPRLKLLENDTANKVDCIIPISKVDEKYFQDLKTNKPIKTLPAAYEIISEIKPLPKQFSVGFIGGLDWLPNAEGVKWFLKEVWNHFVKINTDVNFNLAGRNFPKKFYDLKNSKLFIYGEIESAQEFTLDNSVMIAPILSGSGMRIKIIEAMALGRTVLSTTIGAEGIDYQNNKNIFIADSPEEWIQVLVELSNNRNKLNSVGKAGQELIKKDHDAIKLGKELIDFYKKELC